MVFLSCVLSVPKQIAKRTFIDKVRVYVRGGGGGQGHPRYGGIGGRGANIFAVGDDTATLKNVLRENPKKRFVATNGTNSTSRSIFGTPGNDLDIGVPLGIVVKTDAQRELGEINKVGDRVLLAKGGAGGDPNNGYIGHKGHTLSVTFDLKLIADVGLVGFPNAGKSTLLSAVSRASPKIASYPFTTIQPQKGTIDYPDHRQISLADLPGLIEGAHINVGMGHSFLKHVERTKLLLFVVDIHGFRLSPQHPVRSALENILLLNRELELYKEDLVHKPALLALNKVDVEGSDVMVEQLINNLQHKKFLNEIPEEFIPDSMINFDDIIPISAKNRQNTDHLKQRLRELLDLYADTEHTKLDETERHLQIIGPQLTEHRGAKLV